MKKSEEVYSRINELERQLWELQSKSSNLTDIVEYTNRDVVGLDVYDRTTETNVGNKKEIAAVEKRIEELKEKIKELYQLKRQYELDENKYERNKPEILRKQAEEAKEKERIDDEVQKIEKSKLEKSYKQIKKLYKSGPLLNRFRNIISGNRARFKDVKKLSKEELDFLVKLHYGETTSQKESFEELQKHGKIHGKKASYGDMKKYHQSRNWDKFAKALNSKSYLKNQMEMEERNTSGIGGRGY